MNNKNNKEYISILILCIVGCVFVLLFSYSTSPIYRDFYIEDSAIFLTFGKFWSQGLVPYRDMFDHKGPIIYLVNMLGYKLLGRAEGVMIIQFVFMSFSIAGLYKIGSLFIDNRILLAVCSVFSIIMIKANYVYGDTIEEYCLPFLCWSFYAMLKFYKEDQPCHSLLWAAWYGITFGVCSMTRLTNCIVLCVPLLGIVIELIYKKRFANLFRCIAVFLAGAFVVFLPFAIYFSVEGCFYDFIYGTFIHNVKYVLTIKRVASDLGTTPVLSAEMLFDMYYSAFIAFFVSAFCFIKGDRKMACIIMGSGAVEMVFFLTGSRYVQYPLVCICQVPVAIGEAYGLIKQRGSKKAVRYISGFMVAMLLFVSAVHTRNIVRNMAGQSGFIHDYCSLDNKYTWESLVEENVPEEDKDSFVAYGYTDLIPVYLVCDIIPPYKFCVIQEWYAAFSEEVREGVTACFREGDAKWILVNVPTSCIQDTLDGRYGLYAEKDNYRLYRLVSY